MLNSFKFLLIGGDLRYRYLARGLISDGYTVCVYGFDSKEIKTSECCSFASLQEAVEQSDVIVLPLPVAVDGKTLNAPYSSRPIFIESLFEHITDDKLILGGIIPKSLLEYAREKNLQMVDFFEREELSVLNAIPTAEGALAIAMEELPITIHGSKCLITGYGRVGKLMEKTLNALGANVTVAVRKAKDRAWLKVNSTDSINIEYLSNYELDCFDLVINTVPATIFNQEVLKRLRGDVLIIDLASKPGGVDMEAASRLGLKTIWALSLPGKVAPKTAGIIIKDTILNIIEERKT